jgi:hypothetical protein
MYAVTFENDAKLFYNRIRAEGRSNLSHQIEDAAAGLAGRGRSRRNQSIAFALSDRKIRGRAHVFGAQWRSQCRPKLMVSYRDAKP